MLLDLCTDQNEGVTSPPALDFLDFAMIKSPTPSQKTKFKCLTFHN
jgi:hypothetical protein